MYDERAPRLDGKPPGTPKGPYRPLVYTAEGPVDVIEYVRAYGHGPNGPRDPQERPPHDLFDGPLPGQSFEEWRAQLEGEYYKPPAV